MVKISGKIAEGVDRPSIDGGPLPLRAERSFILAVSMIWSERTFVLRGTNLRLGYFVTPPVSSFD